MKRAIYFFIFTFFISAAVNAQSFELTLHDTELNCLIDTTTAFHIDVTNTTDAELELYVVRQLINFPEGWVTNLCFGACYPPFLDSIVTNSEYGSAPLAAGETRTIDVDVTPTSEETATIKITIASTQNPSDAKTVTLTANGVVTGIDDGENAPFKYSLEQNYPNPFSKGSGGNPATTIKFSLANKSYITLNVYDAVGRKVAELAKGYFSAGIYSYQFNAGELPSGVYFYRIQSGNFTETKRMLLLR